jgi:hypothetical protein
MSAIHPFPVVPALERAIQTRLAASDKLQKGNSLVRHRRMRIAITSIAVFIGYVFLLHAPGILPLEFGFGVYALLALTWFVASLWFVWRVPRSAYALIMSVVILLALLA